MELLCIVRFKWHKSTTAQTSLPSSEGGGPAGNGISGGGPAGSGISSKKLLI